MFICTQKINFITHFFFKILQRNSKLVILGNKGMPGHTHLNWYYQSEETFGVYLQAKNQLHPWCFPWVIPKILQICYFTYFGLAWLHTLNVIVSTCRNLQCFSACQNNLIIHLYPEILHLKESCNLIGRQHFGP